MTRFKAIEDTEGWIKCTASFAAMEKLFQFRMALSEAWAMERVVGETCWIVACPATTCPSIGSAAARLGRRTWREASNAQSKRDPGSWKNSPTCFALERLAEIFIKISLPVCC
jgi:hypothetical protein